jgi:hypothetical protein
MLGLSVRSVDLTGLYARFTDRRAAQRKRDTRVAQDTISQCIACLSVALQEHDQKYRSTEGLKLGHGYRKSIKLLQTLAGDIYGREHPLAEGK